MRARSRSWPERRFDLLVIGGGIVGAGIADEAAQRGSRRRARRPRRLRRGDLERLVEADPRRTAVPPPGRRQARAAGPPRAARAARGPSRLTSSAGSRSCSRFTAVAPFGRARPGSGSRCTRRSPATGSVACSSRRVRAERPRSPARRAARLRRLRGRVDERRAALSCERAGGSRRGRCGRNYAEVVALRRPLVASPAPRCATA